MSDRALLIGSALDGLGGVEKDLDAMKKALGPRFEVDQCTGPDATRAGILSAYTRLIEETGPGDAVVVYYSGHGGRAAAPDPSTPGPERWDLQFIVPADFHQSTADDFRGISSVELSVLLARLTMKTDNVTVVLDCCHAAHMSRDGRHGLRIRAVPKRTPYQVLHDHIERLRASGDLDTGLISATGSEHAVRIVACAPDQSAYEYAGMDGEQTGILTESLTIALAEAGAQRVSWMTVMDRVRRRVLALSPYQRPEVEGPARRILFETDEDDLLTAPTVTDLGGGRARIECAALLGVRHGDAFELVAPPGSGVSGSGVSASGPVGTLGITGLDAFSASGTVEFSAPWTTVPLGARARRVTAAAPALPVLLPEGDQRAAVALEAVGGSPLLRVARADEVWQAEIRVGEDGALIVADRSGPLGAVEPSDSGAMAAVRRDLEALARIAALRALVEDPQWALNVQVAIEWGTVHEGGRRPLAMSDDTVHVGDSMYISVRNDSSADVYVSMIDIGVGGRITVLTRDTPGGSRLASGKEYVFGFNGYTGLLTGVPLQWPAGLDPAAARPETVLVFVSSVPQDVTALEQCGPGRRDAPSTPLAALLQQIADGGRRDMAAMLSSPRYDAHAVEFELDPAPAGGRFLIDERLSRAALARTPRSFRSRQSTVAIRLEELLVHHNRPWLGTDVRVDTIVLTSALDTPRRPAYEARTERFPHIHSGKSLPVDQMLLYHGPAVDYLDLAIWVSRDVSGSPGLGELLAEEISGSELPEDLAHLAGGVGATPGAATAAAALSLAAVVVNVAYKALRGHVGEVIGLYRGSMLAHEGFGVGRHPESGIRQVQDFSLAYLIEEV
jgi:hypothetical protein